MIEKGFNKWTDDAESSLQEKVIFYVPVNLPASFEHVLSFPVLNNES